MKKINKKGFTLVELLAVIVILAVLLVIAVPSMTTLINNSRKNTFLSSVKMVAENVENLSSMNSYMGTSVDCALKINKTDIPLDKGDYGNIKGFVLVKNDVVTVKAYDEKLGVSASGELTDLKFDSSMKKYEVELTGVCSDSNITDKASCTGSNTWTEQYTLKEGTNVLGKYNICKF